MLEQEIKRFFQGEVSTAAADLDPRSEDASIFKIRPKVVVFPKNVDDLKALVQFVVKEKPQHPELSITARSAGTDMSGGPLNDSIVADFTRHINRIEGVSNGTVTSEPGAFYRDVEKITLDKGMIIPSFPASKMLCTIGGMVANNSGGERSLKYGQTKQYIEELHVVFADGNEYVIKPLSKSELDQKMQQGNFEGELYRKVFQLVDDNYNLIQQHKPTTSKNSSGYFLWDVWNKEKQVFDMTQLICGSQGTLGLLTKTKLKLVRPEPKTKMLVIFLNDMKQLGELVHTVVQYKPEAFESYDKHTFSIAMRFLPAMIKRMKGNIIKLGLQFIPELWMTLTGGLPNLVLIAEFTGDDEQKILETVRKARQVVKEKFHVPTHIVKTETEAEKYWTIRRESFSLLRSHAHGLQTAPFIDDIIVHPDQLPEFLPKLDVIFAKYPTLVYTIAGHAGDANFHIIPLMDLKKQSEHEIISKLSHEVYDLVLQYKGSITAEHNDGLVRTPFLEQMFGKEMVGLFKQVKDIFDPLNIFNPHKKVGATEEYMLSQIKH